MMTRKKVDQQTRESEHDPLFVAIEMSRSKWIVGLHSELSDKVSIHSVDWGDTQGLFALIERLQHRVQSKLGVRPSVLCCYEAGYEGFWLQRLLAAAGHCALVIDPASLLINRRAKRAKTDRLDARAMVRALIGFNRGEDQVLNAINVPTVEQEDERRLVRERQRLIKEQTAHTNRIKGLLVTQGVVGFRPREPNAREALSHFRTGDGRPLGPRLIEEISREIQRLRLVMQQLAAVEAERDAIVASGSSDPAPELKPARSDRSMVTALTRLKGVGSNDASVLVREAFWRQFDNRRQLAAWSGFAPTPWASGITVRDQGITKAGPPTLRAHLIQIGWRWLHWQPDSALAKWYHQRTQGASGRVRRVMIVALARKLLIALWRYATIGLVPTGAIVA